MPLTDADRADLRYAKGLLENPSLAAKIADLVGAPIEIGLELLPARVSRTISSATQSALTSALRVAVATMDDELHYIDLSGYARQFTTVRSSLRDAGAALIAELIRQCEEKGPPSGHLIPSSYHLAQGLDGAVLKQPLPKAS